MVREDDTGRTQKEESANRRALQGCAFVAFLFPGVPFAVWLVLWDREASTKLLVAGSAVSAVVAVAITYWLFAQRQVAIATLSRNLAFLLLVVGLFSIAPAVLLGTDNRLVLLNVIAIVVLSLFPGWLYLQFQVVRGRTLYSEYVLNLHRLQLDDYTNLPEPPRGSVFHRLWETSRRSARDGNDNLYLTKFQGLYGQDAGRGGTSASEIQQAAENLLPVMVATLLISAGWTLVLQPEAILDLALINGLTLTNTLSLPGDALRFGFAGTYFFALQVLARRYFQDDLKPSAFISISVRIIAVALLVTVIQTVWPATAQGQLLASAFIIGVFPQLGLQALQSLVKLPLRYFMPSLRRKYPLSDLDGLHIWYESRLLEEGIEDLQNLATANLVDVLLNTRVPVTRLVDWVDQAHLYLRVRNDDGGDGGTSSRARLRRLGIRTATDLEDAFRLGDPDSAEERQQVERLRWVLNPPGDEGQDPHPDGAGAVMAHPSVTAAILKSLANEPNMYHVRCWKGFTAGLKERTQELEEHVEGHAGEASPSTST